MGLVQKLRSLRKGVSTALHVQRKYGVPVSRQFRDIVMLRKNAVGVSDYYSHAMFDPERFPTSREKLTYTGWRAFSTEFRHFSDPKLQAIAYEKHILYRLLDSFNIPTPEIYGLYSPRPNAFERNNAMTSLGELESFFRECDCLPMFGKPSNAAEGFGGRGIMGREPDGNLRLLSGETVTPQALAEDIHEIAMKTGNYLLTEFLANSDDLREIGGETVASFRIVMLVRDGTPEFFRTSVLLPVPGSHVSNLKGFSTGSVACGIDYEEGRISEVLTAPGPDRQSVENHPLTGVRLLDRVIKGWDQVKPVMMEASLAFSPFRMQHWDVALTQRGPVIMEMNFIGAVDGCQVFGPPGLYSEQYLSFRANNRVW